MDKSNPDSRKPTRKLGLIGRQQLSSHSREDRCFTDEEIESEFNTISLSLRTEAFTLQNRLEHQRRQRDLCEESLKKEMEVLLSLLQDLEQEVFRLVVSCNNNNDNSSSSMNSINSRGGGCDFYEKFAVALHQVEVMGSSARRVSSAAETLGAVEHESRLSSAVDLLIQYVDNVKRKWEKEHRELQETKRILQESGLNLDECFPTLNETSAALESSQQTKNPSFNTRRRASVPAAPASRKISLLGAVFKVPLTPAIMEEREEENKLLLEDSLEVSPVSTSRVIPASSIVENRHKPYAEVTAASEQPSISSEKVNNAHNRKRRISRTKKCSKTAKEEPKFRKETTIFLIRNYFTAIIKNIWQRGNVIGGNRASRPKSKCRTTLHHKWGPHDFVDCLRYTVAAIFILAAVFSLIITFVPSSV